MRRVLFGVLSSLLVGTVMATPTLASSNPGADAAVVQMADADWVVRTGPSTGIWYIAGAIRFGPTSPDGMLGMGFVGRGKCTFRKFRHGSMVSCGASAHGKKVGPTEFQMDPLLASASLEMESEGFSHHVVWTGQGDYPAVDQSIQTYGPYFYASAHMVRPASAVGDIFDEHLESRRFSFTFLAQGAEAQGSLSALGFDVNQRGPQAIHRTFWIPRRSS